MRKASAVWMASLSLAAAAVPAAAQRPSLPDFGTPADTALSKDAEAQLGRSVMRELYEQPNVIVDDPELTEYLASLGSRLATHANDGTFRFRFFIVEDPSINAFALPGGYIGVNTGLILATENESELAGVLAHEVSHVTQRHIARSIYDSQRTSVTSLAAMIAAVLLGASGNASGDAVQGAVAATQAYAAQRQINFTRANEYEADRIGIGVLSAAGYDPHGMATFFEKISRRYINAGDRVPPLLQTHPVSTDRIAEARSRARLLPRRDRENSMAYELAKTRLMVREAASASGARAQFAERAERGAAADRYGLALASMRMGIHDHAELLFRELAAEYPTVIAFRTGHAEALYASGFTDRALTAYADAVRLFPRNVPLTISYAKALMAAGKPAEAHDLLLDLFNNVAATPEQLKLIARAASEEGDVGNAYFYTSYYDTAVGDLAGAIGHLRLALDARDVNTVDRARFRARLEELIGYLPEEYRASVRRGGPIPQP